MSALLALRRRPAARPARTAARLLLLALLAAARALSAQVHPGDTLRVMAVGDLMLGTITVPRGLPADDGRALFAEAPLAGDIVLGNLEAPFVSRGRSGKCPRGARRCFAFGMPWRLLPRLVEAGFTHLHVANNHIDDFGVPARARTLERLAAAGITPFGVDSSIATLVLARPGGLLRVALLAVSPYDFGYRVQDVDSVALRVRDLRRAHDLVLVSMHAGAEGARAAVTPDAMERLGDEERGHVRRFARAMIDAGAAMVIGHGPHVLRGMEWHRGRLIVYSLGNFVTYAGFANKPPLDRTGILDVTLMRDGRVRTGRFVPMRQVARAGPRRDDSTRAALRFVAERSRVDFPGTGVGFDSAGVMLGGGGGR